MAYPDDLLDQAFGLIHKDPNRPKQASLRRAISTAYYALFHLLINEAAANWRQPSSRSVLVRGFEHGVMKAASQRVGNVRLFPFSGEDPRVVKSLRLVAESFARLQEKRHIADYDTATPWSRVEALKLVQAAGAAFAEWRTIRNERIARDFLTTLLVKKRD